MHTFPSKSFPSSLNRGGNSLQLENVSNDKQKTALDNAASNSDHGFDLSRMKSMNINLTPTIGAELLQEKYINIANNANYPAEMTMIADSNNTSEATYEMPHKMSSELLSAMNNYRFIYKKATKTLVDIGKNGSAVNMLIAHTASAPSIFNPMFNVQVVGMQNNVPLLNDVSNNRHIDSNVTDCSIKTLVSESNSNHGGKLGMAAYKYADFMYCKDLGKVSNNHLITLRRFSHPVGDNIFEMASSKYSSGASGSFDYSTEGDIGRLITWFGTDDNKLEDILKYSYQMSWKELTAKVDQYDSKEDADQRGFLGMVANSWNPAYNRLSEGGFTGTNNIWSKIGAKLSIAQKHSDTPEILRNYDDNKIYTPLNTVQDTYTYEGRLTFSQEFNITFSYKLRAYQNINPKSAFLDLLGNILEVTYRRGKFWGGSRKIIGPPQNKSMWQKENAFLDNNWAKLGGFMSSLAAGTTDFSSILASVSSFAESLPGIATGIVNKGAEAAKKIVSGGADGAVQSMMSGLMKLNSTVGFSSALKGQLKNALGRPALYALDSLLSGDNVGLWHVTIGNPKNPIASIGNLIMTNASVQQLGPLGIDDFPTELRVTVTLKHGRSRDLTEISRMYTNGVSGLYINKSGNMLKDFANVNGNADDTAIANAHKLDNAVSKNTKTDKNGKSKITAQSIDDPYKPSNLDTIMNNEKKELYGMSNNEISSGLIETSIAARRHMLNQELISAAVLAGDEIA